MICWLYWCVRVGGGGAHLRMALLVLFLCAKPYNFRQGTVSLCCLYAATTRRKGLHWKKLFRVGEMGEWLFAFMTRRWWLQMIVYHLFIVVYIMLESSWKFSEILFSGCYLFSYGILILCWNVCIVLPTKRRIFIRGRNSSLTPLAFIHLQVCHKMTKLLPQI